MHPSDYHCPFHGLFMIVSTQIIACCAYRCSYLRFSYPFRPRAESATFLFATVDAMLFCNIFARRFSSMRCDATSASPLLNPYASMTNSTSEWPNSSPFVGEMILTIVAAQSRAQLVTGPPPSEMLRRSNERRCVSCQH